MATVGAVVSLPQEVMEITTRYRAAGGEDVLAAFVIGSAALGDWWAGTSDIDMVALVDSIDPAYDQRLRDIHAHVRADLGGAAPDLEVLYLTDGDLAQAPAQVGSRPHHRSGLVRRDADMSTPVVWHSLAQHAVPVGDPVELGELWLDDSELGEWCRSSLELDPGERALVEEAISLRRAAPDAGPHDGRDAAERRERVVAFLRRIIDESRRRP